MKTLIYVVSAENGMYRGKELIASFLSKQQADFFAWKSNRSQTYSAFGSLHFIVHSVSIESVDMEGKEWKEFVVEQIKKIDDSIDAKNSHSEQDLEQIESLKKERVSYE